MEQISKVVSYDIKYVSAAVLDIVETMSRDVQRDKETGQITATVKVYDNESKFAFDVKMLDTDSTRLCVGIICPAAVLSEEGRKRAVNFLSDSILQLLENVFNENTICAEEASK